MQPSAELREAFGDIDIYLFDQLLRGRFDGRRRVLDAGCGRGRNLVWLLARGFDVYATDRDPRAVETVRRLVAAQAPGLPVDRVRVAEVESLPWPDDSMDAVVSSAVLHFARNADHFEAMLREMWRVLASEGLFFARLASTIGLEARLPGDAAGQRVQLPDGSERFVVDESMLLDWTARLGGRLLDPIKTTNVQGLRAMTTWVVAKE